MYRAPLKAPIGEWARFLHRHRQAADWSQQQAFEHLRAGLRLGPKSRASYLALDMGSRQPKPYEVDYLTERFGEGPQDVDRAPVVEQVSIAALLIGLTEAIDRQTAALLGRFEMLEVGQATSVQMLGVIQGTVEELRAPGADQTDTPPTRRRRTSRSAPAGLGQ